MNTRSSIYAGFGLLILALCYFRWFNPRHSIHRADTVMSSGPSPGALVTAVEQQAQAFVAETAKTTGAPGAADSTSSAQAIQSRGLALHEENRKVREDLANGDFSALPDALKVADLTLETSPPRPVPVFSGP